MPRVYRNHCLGFDHNIYFLFTAEIGRCEIPPLPPGHAFSASCLHRLGFFRDVNICLELLNVMTYYTLLLARDAE